MTGLLKKMDLLKVLLSVVVIFMFTYNYMLYVSTNNYIAQLKQTPFYSKCEIYFINEDYGKKILEDSDVQKISDAIKEDSKIENVHTEKFHSTQISLTDKENNGYSEENIEYLLYDKVYDKYINMDLSKNEIGAGEVILPQYYVPGNSEAYGNKGYIDGEQLIGHEIEYRINVYSPEESEEPCIKEIKLKVIGTYDNAKANISGTQIIIAEDTISEWYSGCNFNVDYDELNSNLFVIHFNSPDTELNFRAELENLDMVKKYGEFVMTERRGDIDTSDIICALQNNCMFYKKVILVSCAMGIIILIAFVIYGIIRKNIIVQIKEVSLATIIAYVISLFAVLYFMVEHNNSMMDKISIDRYFRYTYSIGNLVLGIAMIIMFVIFTMLDRKKVTGRNDER